LALLLVSGTDNLYVVLKPIRKQLPSGGGNSEGRSPKGRKRQENKSRNQAGKLGGRKMEQNQDSLFSIFLPPNLPAIFPRLIFLSSIFLSPFFRPLGFPVGGCD
jgi:hypothetical protein